MVYHGELHAKMNPVGQIKVQLSQNGGVYVQSYNVLLDKPSINGHILIGDSDFEAIGLHFMTNTEIRDLLGGNNNGN